MNSLKRMLVVYMELVAEIRFSRYCAENHYRLEAVRKILGLTPDDEEALKRVFGQGRDQKDAATAIALFERQISDNHVSVNEIINHHDTSSGE